MAPLRAGIYSRISLDRTGQELGVTRQVNDCTALAKRMGWTIADTYVDNDLSASTGKLRPEYQRLLADLKAGVIGAVVTYHPDRLTRRPIELEELIEVLDAAGAPVATVAAGDYDLGNASGRMVARILGSIARGEAERMGERVARKKLELAEQGKPPGGGMRAYGYERDGMTLRPAEAEVLRRAAADVLAGESYYLVARRLTEAGTVPDNGKWTQTHLKRVLTGARWAGLRTYHGTVVGPAAWPAIIEPGTRDALLDLAERRKQSAGRRGDPYLTAGVIRCQCGAKLYQRYAPRKAGPVRCYHCSPHQGCGRLEVRADPVDDEVTAHVERLLAEPDGLRAALARLAGGDDLVEVEGQIGQVEQQLADLASRHASNDLEPVEWAALRGPLRERLTALRGRRATLSPGIVSVDPAALSAAWKVADTGGRNAILRVLGVQVVVARVGRGSRAPVADRLTVTPPA